MTTTSAPTATKPQSGADILARIKPQLREETTELCLRPDLLDAHAEAAGELAVARAEEAAGARLSSGVSAKTRKLAERVKEIEAEIQDTVIVFRLRAMPQDKYRILCDNHPPRKGNEMDGFVGYNRDAVLDASVRVCLYDPEFDDVSWQAFLAVCNPSEWNELRSVVNSVNRSVADAPKSELASLVLAKPARASKRQPASA